LYELPWDIKLKIALGAARGMAYLHSQDMIHRDLKSLNLLVMCRVIFASDTKGIGRLGVQSLRFWVESC